MLRNILTVFRKELVDTLRDRKTLAFMLLIPTLLTPVLMLAGSRIVENIAKKKAVERVVIVADAESQERYRAIVHRWFTEASRDPVFRFAFVPAISAMISADDASLRPPAEIHKDPAAFEKWIRGVGDKATEALTDLDLRERLKSIKIPEGGIPDAPGVSSIGADPQRLETFLDFYLVGLRGLAFVDFKAPDTVAAASADFVPANVPKEMLDLPRGRDMAAAIRDRRVAGWLMISTDPAEALADTSRTFEVAMWHDSTLPSSDEAYKRVSRVLDRTGDLLVQSRLRERSLKPAFLKPLAPRAGTNISTTSQIVLSAIGGFLPYLVIAYAFLGALYPAIDLGAGEKERNTLETLLLSPATRTEIALGKFLVIFTTSLVAAILGIASIAVSMMTVLPPGVLDRIDLKLEPVNAVAVSLLALPPAAAIAALFLAISIFARSFKEAQNYIAPMQFLLIMPPMAGLIPGVEMNWKLAMIPLVNVGLLAKDFLKGDVNWMYYGLTVVSTLGLAAASIAYCVWQFKREEVLFRT